MGTSKELSFNIIDDITQLPASQLDSARVWFKDGVQANTLGPMLEMAAQSALVKIDLPFLATHIQGAVCSAVVGLLSKSAIGRAPISSSLKPLAVEVCGGLGMNGSDAESLRMAFFKRAERAAHSAGFSKKTASGICGAIQEMSDNVTQHSERIDSGLIGYRWLQGEFEFVVADSGIGILNSLRKCPAHSALADHGAAICLALDGNSRFGIGAGHGFGFRQLFVNLAGLHGSLRFRSGDHSVEIDGSSPGVAMARTAQQAIFQGFMLSAVCRPD